MSTATRPITPQIFEPIHAAIQHPGKLFKPAEAEALAAALNADPDEEWTYTVKHDPTGHGLSLIQIFDEDGYFLANI